MIDNVKIDGHSVGDLFIDGHLAYKHDYDWGGLCFEAAQAGSTVAYHNNGTNAPDMKYSFDTVHWNTWNADSPVTLTHKGSRVFVKGDNASGFSTSSSNYTNFVMTGSIKASGSVMSLIDNDEGTEDTIPCNYCFLNTFVNCAALITPPALPATSLTYSCYGNNFPGAYHNGGMFRNCTNLLDIPELPASSIPSGAYSNMFYNCASLTKLDLSKKIKAVSFNGSSILSTTFSNCTNLKQVRLPNITDFTNAHTLYQIFANCFKLELVEIDFVNWHDELTYGISLNWLQNAGTQATNPTIVCPFELDTSVRDVSHVPEGWRVAKKVKAAVSDGGQFIDTGIVPNDKTGIKSLWWTNITNTQIGVYKTGSNDRLQISYDGYSIRSLFCNNAQNKPLGTQTDLFDCETNYLNSRKLKVDNLSSNITEAMPNVHTHSITMFALWAADNFYKYKFKQADFQITQDQDIIWDATPIIFTDTQEVCFFERVAGIFKHNEGTGSFVYEVEEQ